MPCVPFWVQEARARLVELDAAGPPGFPGSITAFFPAYNDAPTIGAMVEFVDAVLQRVTADYEIVVVNDGSTDETAEVLAAAALAMPCLRVISHPHNLGYGAALRAGFAAATREWVFYTDGDAQYDPTELLDLLPHAHGADLVNGYKRRRSDGVYRTILGVAYRELSRWMFGVRIRDVDCDFRLIRRALLDQPLTSENGSICVELIYRLERAGAKTMEVPVHHYRRPAGRSQFLQLRTVVLSLHKLALLWWQLRVQPVIRSSASRVLARSRGAFVLLTAISWTP